jgi:hypothetical protein
MRLAPLLAPALLLAAASCSAPASPPDIRVWGGGYEPNDPGGGLESFSSGSALGVGATFWTMADGAVGIDADLVSLRRDNAGAIPGPPLAPFFGVASAYSDGLTAGLRGRTPPLGPFRAHLRAGAGVYHTDMELTGVGTGGPSSPSESSWDLGPQLGAELEGRFGRFVVSLALMQVWLDASFNDLGLGEVDLGGTFIGIGFGMMF